MFTVAQKLSLTFCNQCSHFVPYQHTGDERCSVMHVNLTLKSLSSTCWSSRAESIKAQLRETLNSISKDRQEKRETKSDASALCGKLDAQELSWHTFGIQLQQFQATSLQLQKHDIDVDTASPFTS